LLAKIQTIELETIFAVGHTDSDGSNADNQLLSQRRANAVKAYLVKHGINTNRIQTSGKGESSPVASNTTVEGKAKNRRVDIDVVGR
jgi:OOP family OmpA-OmpF porin